MKIDIEKLEEIKIELSIIKNNINNNFNNIKTEIGNLSSYWEGDAASEYISKANKLSSGFSDYINGLEKLINMLETSINDKEEASSNIINYV